MDKIEIQTAVLNEEAWSAWVQRGIVRDRALARRWKIIGGIGIPAAVILGLLYTFLR